MIMELTQYKPLAPPGFCGQEGSFLCYARFYSVAGLSFGHKQTCLAAGGKEILLPGDETHPTEPSE
jgi:hypothetical protein